MGILNSNDYQRGYKDGYNDGKNGRDKNYSRGGMSLKYAIHGNRAYETYCEGYNEGYRKGSYDRNKR
ncbi:MAG: hypothetical protein J6T70_01340 [Bacteroidales bacterium]|nr:hypothetical protein [Bacteroidales bacterium]